MPALLYSPGQKPCRHQALVLSSVAEIPWDNACSGPFWGTECSCVDSIGCWSGLLNPPLGLLSPKSISHIRTHLWLGILMWGMGEPKQPSPHLLRHVCQWWQHETRLTYQILSRFLDGVPRSTHKLVRILGEGGHFLIYISKQFLLLLLALLNLSTMSSSFSVQSSLASLPSSHFIPTVTLR